MIFTTENTEYTELFKGFSTCPERDLLSKSCGFRDLCALGGEVFELAHEIRHFLA